MKLIIDIPEEDREDICNIHFVREDLKFKVGKAIMNGTPLDDDSERAEVQAYFDGEAYGWEQGRKALIDDVKAEIEKTKRFHIGTFEDDNPIDYGIVEGFDKAIAILDNIGKAESEDI